MAEGMSPVYDTLLSLVKNHLVLFAPKTKHGLKLDYPELAKAPEFRDMGMYDMKFVWAMGCRSSPFTSIDETASRIAACVKYAYPIGDQNKRLSTYLNKIPEKTVAAIGRMERYSLEARVIEYLLMRQVRENIAAIAMTNIAGKDDDTKKAYLDQMKVAQTILADQRTRIEGMDLGVAEEGDTAYKEAVDVWSEYIQNHDNQQDPD